MLKENTEFTTSQISQKSPKCKICVRNEVTKKDRICKQCNEAKPLADFDENSHKCNECKNICKNLSEKKCSKCKTEKPMNEFTNSMKSLDGKDLGVKHAGKKINHKYSLL